MFKQIMNLKLNFMNVGSVCFIIVALLNFSCLCNPPYWDDILGLHNQAIFLANNHFDIARLWEPGQEYSNGGSNIYPLGIIPLFYGILYSLFKPGHVHVIGHLFNIACLSISFTLFFMILRKYYISKLVALLWCIAALCEPVMSGRTAELGQESPLIALAAAAIYCIAFRKIWTALIFILLASFVKPTAGLLAFALVVLLIIGGTMPSRFFRKKFLNAKWGEYFIGSIAVSLIIISISICFLTGETYKSLPCLSSLLNRLIFIFSRLLPVQALLLVGAIAVALISISQMKAIKNLWRNWFSIYLFIFILGFWFVFFLFPVPLPRYTGFVVFPTCAFIALNVKKKYCNLLLASLIIMLGIVTMGGIFYLSIDESHRRSGEYLERSREYIADLRSNVEICKNLEQDASLRPIVAKWPFVQMITMPELGYVNKPMACVYSVGTLPKYTSAKRFTGFKDMIDGTLYIYVFNSFEIWSKFGPSLRPSPCDQVVISDNTLDGLLLVYQKK